MLFFIEMVKVMFQHEVGKKQFVQAIVGMVLALHLTITGSAQQQL